MQKMSARLKICSCANKSIREMPIGILYDTRARIFHASDNLFFQILFNNHYHHQKWKKPQQIKIIYYIWSYFHIYIKINTILYTYVFMLGGSEVGVQRCSLVFFHFKCGAPERSQILSTRNEKSIKLKQKVIMCARARTWWDRNHLQISFCLKIFFLRHRVHYKKFLRIYVSICY